MKNHKWSIPRCQQYFSHIEGLKRQLLVYIHFTRGFPRRGSEITTIKWCNTRHTMSNIFVYHGRLMVLIKYNKNRASTNNAFYIARFLPLTISRILFQYLTYVRPFYDAVTDRRLNGLRLFLRATGGIAVCQVIRLQVRKEERNVVVCMYA